MMKKIDYGNNNQKGEKVGIAKLTSNKNRFKARGRHTSLLISLLYYSCSPSDQI